MVRFRWNREHASMFGYGYKNKALPAEEPYCVLGFLDAAGLRTLMVLKWVPFCHTQVGVEGREGEGCGTVGLLLEHSFEIGESNNVLTWTLSHCPVNSGASPCDTRHPFTHSFAFGSVFCINTGELDGGRIETAFEYLYTGKTNARVRKVTVVVISSEQTFLTTCPVPCPGRCSSCINSSDIFRIVMQSRRW